MQSTLVDLGMTDENSAAAGGIVPEESHTKLQLPSLIDYTPISMFQQLDIYINGTAITSQGVKNAFPYSSYMRKVLFTKQSAMQQDENQLELFWCDKGTDEMVTDPYASRSSPVRKRAELYAGSKKV